MIAGLSIEIRQDQNTLKLNFSSMPLLYSHIFQICSLQLDTSYLFFTLGMQQIYLNYLRLYSIQKSIEKFQYLFQLSDFQLNLGSLIKLSFLLILSVHILGTLWYKINECWIQNYFLGEPQDTQTLFITSLYWSVTTMITVGFGDVLPISYKEKVFSIITMLLGCCLFSYVMNCIGGLFDQIRDNDKDLKDQMKKLNYFLMTKPIDNQLKIKLRKYTDHLYKKKKVMKDSVKLSLKLKEELMVRIFNFFTSIPSFLQEIREFQNGMKEYVFLPEEQINLHGLVFVLNGCVAQQLTKSSKPIKRYMQGQMFGDLEHLYNQTKQGSYFAERKICQTYFLDSNEIIEALRNKYNQRYQELQDIKDSIIFNSDLSFLNRSCQICYKIDHNVFRCPQTHFVANRYRIYFSKTYQKSCSFNRRKRQNKLTLRTIQVEAIIFMEDNNFIVETQSQSISEDFSQDLDSMFRSQLLEEQIANGDLEQEKETPSLTKSPREQVHGQRLQKQREISISMNLQLRGKLANNVSEDTFCQIRTQRRMKTAFQKKEKSNQPQESFSCFNDFDKGTDFSHYKVNYNLSTVLVSFFRASNLWKNHRSVLSQVQDKQMQQVQLRRGSRLA